MLGLSAPDGQFTLPTPRPSRILFISGSSGITPVLSMLRTLADGKHRGEIVFSHYASGADDVLHHDELAQQSPTVRVVLGYTHAEGADLRGFVSAEHVERAVVSRRGDLPVRTASTAATLAAGASVAVRSVRRSSAGSSTGGAGAIMWMPRIAVPCLLFIGFAPLGAAGYVLVVLLANVVIIGGNGGAISISGIFYRPSIRASGGWAASVSQLGAMLGPVARRIVAGRRHDSEGDVLRVRDLPDRHGGGARRRWSPSPRRNVHYGRWRGGMGFRDVHVDLSGARSGTATNFTNVLREHRCSGGVRS
ncbi:hypothetical protein LWP59_34920 [Amycolatopsis acidiphila]|uniref:hypothetical protein n=1 Tax=Amycolatopsis acidiphila TaxID=715473 RepID=UPI0019C8381B|nr:hypothetical protein [Amycolatopsis acidiphila]UIJ59188.1 hypothetical protein LWP59_34920 [Amycolatopsis acidiphila]GHG79027.1 hypothetical protein GCM10017788_46720 [Amycolatopsis acidiphila]